MVGLIVQKLKDLTTLRGIAKLPCVGGGESVSLECQAYSDLSIESTLQPVVVLPALPATINEFV